MARRRLGEDPDPQRLTVEQDAIHVEHHGTERPREDEPASDGDRLVTGPPGTPLIGGLRAPGRLTPGATMPRQRATYRRDIPSGDGRAPSAFGQEDAPVASQPLLMGIDLGTSSVKVVLTSIDGRIAGQGAAEYGIDRPAPDRAEQHPDAWWRGVVDATAAALGEASHEAPDDAAPAARIVAVGLSGQMHGLVLLSGAHEPLAPAVIWPDQRSGQVVTDLTTRLGVRELHPLVRRAPGQRLHGGDPCLAPHARPGPARAGRPVHVPEGRRAAAHDRGCRDGAERWLRDRPARPGHSSLVARDRRGDRDRAGPAPAAPRVVGRRRHACVRPLPTSSASPRASPSWSGAATRPSGCSGRG